MFCHIGVLLMLVLAQDFTTQASAWVTKSPPRPVHGSCTHDVIANLSCGFAKNSCGYRTANTDTSRGNLYWYIGPRGSRNPDYNYLTNGDNHAPRGSKIELNGYLKDPSVTSICMEFRYRGVGSTGISVVNQDLRGRRRTIGSGFVLNYPQWKVARYHSCVFPNSTITFSLTKRRERLSVDLDGIKVTRSTMDCTGYGEETTHSPTTPFPAARTNTSKTTPATPLQESTTRDPTYHSNSTRRPTTATSPLINPTKTTTLSSSNVTSLRVKSTTPHSNVTTKSPSRGTLSTTAMPGNSNFHTNSRKPQTTPRGRNYTISTASPTPYVAKNCTYQSIPGLTCGFGGNSCSYQTPDSRPQDGKLHWVLNREGGRNFVQVVDSNSSSETSTVLWAPLNEQGVSSVCIEFHYRATGIHSFHVVNVKHGSSAITIGRGSTSDSKPNWETAMFHSCVHPDSKIAIVVTKKTPYLSFDLASVLVNKGLLNCTSHDTTPMSVP